MTMPKIAGWSLQLSLLQLVTRVISGCTYNPNSGHSKSNMWSGFFFCGPTWRCFVLCFSTFSVSFLFNHHLYWDVFCCVSIRTRRNRDLHFSYSRSHLLPPDGWMDGVMVILIVVIVADFINNDDLNTFGQIHRNPLSMPLFQVWRSISCNISRSSKNLLFFPPTKNGWYLEFIYLFVTLLKLFVVVFLVNINC